MIRVFPAWSGKCNAEFALRQGWGSRQSANQGGAIAPAVLRRELDADLRAANPWDGCMPAAANGGHRTATRLRCAHVPATRVCCLPAGEAVAREGLPQERKTVAAPSWRNVLRQDGIIEYEHPGTFICQTASMNEPTHFYFVSRNPRTIRSLFSHSASASAASRALAEERSGARRA